MNYSALLRISAGLGDSETRCLLCARERARRLRRDPRTRSALMVAILASVQAGL